MPLESLLGPRVTSAIAYATAALTLFSLLYGFAKIAWTKVTGKPFPHNALTRQLDALAELGSNIVGFVNKLSPASPLIANPEVMRRDAMLAEVRAELAAVTSRLPTPPSVGPLAPPPRETLPPPAPIAPTPLRAVTLTGVAAADATQAQYESARAFVAGASGFDPARTQDVTHAAATARAILDPAPPANDREGE